MKITSTSLYNTHVFEVVEKMPAGYFVWNIGDNMEHDDYIPICEKAHPNDPESYDINITTLKAIRLDPAAVKELREAAHWSDRKRAAAASTIDIFKAITA